MTIESQETGGSIAALIATIGTALTFTGTVTHASYLAGYQRGTLNRRLVVEDHGVTVKTIVGTGWANQLSEGDTLTLRGPIKGYEIEPRGLVIVLHRTRPIRTTSSADHPGTAETRSGWPPAAHGGARQRFRSRHDPLLRPTKTTATKRPPTGQP
ncbi:MAG: hypothetical protein QM779_11645 [Propionicimonas sp.]|uniref:hypothetical protein n=1 Tax=Propionicimonas sp. TaxID=1955623 RepID=UPI003D0BAA82